MNLAIVVTTCPHGEGERLKKIILEKKLGACESSFGVSSLYWWKGELVSDEEEFLIIKSVEEKVEELYEIFKEEHLYTVPELEKYCQTSDEGCLTSHS